MNLAVRVCLSIASYAGHKVYITLFLARNTSRLSFICLAKNGYIENNGTFPFDISLKNRYNNQIMKTNLHPTDYRPVVFSDDVAGFAFLTQSTAQTKENIKWEDGNEYPLIKVHISSASHPFFTGEEKIIDTEGRVDRYKAKFAAAEARKAALASKAIKAKAVKAKKAER